MHAPPSRALVPTYDGSIKDARLSFCKLVYLPIINATILYLFVEHDTVKTHIGANRPHKRVVVFVRLGNNAFAISKTMAYPMGHSAFLSKMPYYGAVLTLTLPLPGDFDLLLHCEGL